MSAIKLTGAIFACALSSFSPQAARADAKVYHPTFGGLSAGMTYQEVQAVIAKHDLINKKTDGPTTQNITSPKAPIEMPFGQSFSVEGDARDGAYKDLISGLSVGHTDGKIAPGERFPMVTLVRKFEPAFQPSVASLDALLAGRFGDTPSLVCDGKLKVFFYDDSGHLTGPGDMNCAAAALNFAEIYKLMKAGSRIPPLAVETVVTDDDQNQGSAKGVMVMLFDMQDYDRKFVPLYEKYLKMQATPSKALDGL